MCCADVLVSSRVCCLQVVNYNHMMPTRYTLDVDLKGVVSNEVVDDSSKKTDANKVGCGRHVVLSPCTRMVAAQVDAGKA